MILRKLQHRLFRQRLWLVYLYYVLVLLLMTSLATAFIFAIDPDVRRNFWDALRMATGVALPLGIDAEDSAISIGLIAAGITFMATLLVLVHVYFEAIVTAKLIHPGANLRTSATAVHNTRWRTGSNNGFITMRLVNWDDADLFEISIRATVTVQEEYGGDSPDVIRLYFPIPAQAIDPHTTLVLPPRLPWTIAINTDVELSNSIKASYRLNIGEPMTPACNPHRKAKITRRLELLICGQEGLSATNFTVHKTIDMDTQDEDGAYLLKLVPGRFSSLGLSVTKLAQINQVDIQLAVQRNNYDCGVGAAMSGAIMLGKVPTYPALAEALRTNPQTGTHNSAMAAWGLAQYPGGNAGPGSYTGGLAIANITISRTGHYVLFLGRQGNRIRFWCSWVGAIVDAQEDEIDWVNGDGTLSKWAVNLARTSFYQHTEQFWPAHETIYGVAPGKILSWQEYSKMVAGYEDRKLKTSRLNSPPG